MSTNILTRNGYGISLDKFTKEQLEQLKQDLTIKPFVIIDYDFGHDNSFPIYRISQTMIYVPRFYGLNNYGPFTNKIKDGTIANLEFVYQLKEHQVEFCKKIIEELNTNGSCIGCSGTGSGKTIMALWIASQI